MGIVRKMRFIETLREGERISEVYLCRHKQTAMTKAGKPYAISEISYAYGTPFSGKTDENVNKKVKLQGICMLERGENRIRQIQPAEAIPLILQQTIRPKNEKYLGKMMEIMDQLLREGL